MTFVNFSIEKRYKISSQVKDLIKEVLNKLFWGDHAQHHCFRTAVGISDEIVLLLNRHPSDLVVFIKSDWKNSIILSEMEHIEDEENKKPYKVSLFFRDSFKFPSHISFNIPPRKKIIFSRFILFCSFSLLSLFSYVPWQLKKSKTI